MGRGVGGSARSVVAASVVSRLTIVGLGPSGLDRTPARVVELLDAADVVILRTVDHPAAASIAERREVVTCDDLYEASTFDNVYTAVADRVARAAQRQAVVYAVPGSPLVGERTVPMIRERVEDAGIPVEVVPAESFVDAICAAAGIDALFDGLRVIDGRDLPGVLWLDAPTIIGHVDVPVVLSEVLSRLGEIIDHSAQVGLANDVGGNGDIEWTTLGEIDADRAGYRVSLIVPPVDGGLRGAVSVVATLRRLCPWDREQTHHSITHNLIEEAHELADALSMLPDSAPHGLEVGVGDVAGGAYADVEEELGDVLFQVLFHATMGAEAGLLSLDTVGEVLRQKLVRRHPHVFADVEATTPEEVVANWDVIKSAEKRRQSRLDGVPRSLPALARAHKLSERAARAGFDWPDVAGVRAKLDEELTELEAAATHEERVDELGDVAFTVVNLARRLEIDPALALRRAADRFEERFRRMEAVADLEGLSPAELDSLWEQVK